MGETLGVYLYRDSKAARKTLNALELPRSKTPFEFDRTLVWDPSAHLAWELVPHGFRWLDMWEVAAPILSYSKLAADLGTPEERERLKEIVLDLRVPLYDSRMIFLRNCQAAQELWLTFEEEQKHFANQNFAFLVALWKIKPLMLALPTCWVKP